MKKVIYRVLFLFLMAVLIVSLFRRILGGNSLTFNGLLDYLSNTQGVSIDINISNFSIGGNWGIVDGLRQFFNIFAKLFGVLVWLGSNLINLILFLAQFVSFVFAV